MKEPRGLFLIACPRSGSTLFMQIFAESPDDAVTSRLTLMGKAGPRETFRPDDSILENPYRHSVFVKAMYSGKRFIVFKVRTREQLSEGRVSVRRVSNTLYTCDDPTRFPGPRSHSGFRQLEVRRLDRRPESD